MLLVHSLQPTFKAPPSVLGLEPFGLETGKDQEVTLFSKAPEAEKLNWTEATSVEKRLPAIGGIGLLLFGGVRVDGEEVFLRTIHGVVRKVLLDETGLTVVDESGRPIVGEEFS